LRGDFTMEETFGILHQQKLEASIDRLRDIINEMC